MAALDEQETAPILAGTAPRRLPESGGGHGDRRGEEGCPRCLISLWPMTPSWPC